MRASAPKCGVQHRQPRRVDRVVNVPASLFVQRPLYVGAGRTEKLQERLAVCARAREGGRRRVGRLWKDAEGYAFAYVPEVRVAQAEGFRLLPEFPKLRDEQEPYRSRYLFATFAQRVPSPKRTDFDATMASWRVANVDDPLEILAASGVQMTDRIELVEHRTDDDDLSVPLFIRIAGTQDYEPDQHVHAGTERQLVREPNNVEDKFATMLRAPVGQQIGHIPAQYSQIVARVLDAGQSMRALAVLWQAVPASPRHLIVRLSRTPDSRRIESMPIGAS
jgi:hypothetical protein